MRQFIESPKPSIQETPDKLSQRLDIAVRSDPHSYNLQTWDPDSVSRVRKFIERRFPNSNSISAYKRHLLTVEDLILYWRLHPNWSKFSYDSINRFSEIELKVFKNHIWSVCRKEAFSRSEDLTLHINRITTVRVYRRNYKDLDDWVKELQYNPLWLKHKNSNDFRQDNYSDASNFFSQFESWVRKTAGSDQKMREKLRDSIFLTKTNTSKFKNPEDFKDEHKRISITGVRFKMEKLQNLYSAAKKFANESIEPGLHRQKFLSELNPNGQNKPGFDFGYGEVKFDSKIERIVGILLFELNVVKIFEEKANLHVRVNVDGLNNVDFLLPGGILLEVHPIVPYYDSKKGITTATEFASYKRLVITDPQFQSSDFFHITKVEELLEVLNMKTVKRARKTQKSITNQEFNDKMRKAKQLANDFDVNKLNVRSGIE